MKEYLPCIGEFPKREGENSYFLSDRLDSQVPELRFAAVEHIQV